MLITTLPSPHREGLIEKMFSHPEVAGARYNVGIRTSYSPEQALRIVKNLADEYNKKLWIDLKGRQLRITKWADPTYSDIELSHEVEVDLPAKIFFRGDDWSNVVDVDGNKVIINPDPPSAVGAGQAVNIIGENLKIKGSYLTDTDREYIEAAKKLGIHDYMLSFVEQENDLSEVISLDPDSRLVFKIESIPGLEFVANDYSPNEYCKLMAARDDLMINIGENKTNMLGALELILKKDPDAIVASHLLTSLCNPGYLTMADISDLTLLHDMGYQNFMLSDGVSHKCFEEAVRAWLDFKQVYNKEGLSGSRG